MDYISSLYIISKSILLKKKTNFNIKKEEYIIWKQLLPNSLMRYYKIVKY